MAIDFSLINIIPAGDAYNEFFFQARKEAFRNLITRVWGGWDEAFQRKTFAEEMEGSKPDVILYKNQPIGCFCLTKQEDCYVFEHFFILPEYQDQGIGSFVLKKSLETADKDRLPVRLRYWNFNPAAALYARMGFEVTGREEFEGNKDYLVTAERKPKTQLEAKRKYKAVIFDLFGTLVDNFSQDEYKKTLEEMASILSAPSDGFARLWLETFNQRSTGFFKSPEECIHFICRELKVEINESRLNQAGRIRFDFTLRCLNPRAEAVPVITALKASGHKIGLVSDCTSETPKVWTDTAFAPLFDVTVFSCRAGVKKPDPRIYHMAIKSLQVKPQDCLYIGDGSSRELTGALGVGMHPVLIRDPNDSADAHYIDREDNWSGLVITSLKEVLNLL